MKKLQAIQISIPQPCSEDWQKMTPQEKGRYCDACQKCVVDFTGFSDRQLYDYFIQHAGEKTCGRFHNTQLNRPINIPPQPHSKLYRIAIALGLAIAVVTAAEQRSFAKAPLVEYSFVDNYNTDDTTQNKNKSKLGSIQGQVLDAEGEPIINCIVEVVHNDIVKGAAITDFDGNYILKPLPLNIEYEIWFKYASYKPTSQKGIILTSEKALTIDHKVKASDRRIEIEEVTVICYRLSGLVDPNLPTPTKDSTNTCDDELAPQNDTLFNRKTIIKDNSNTPIH